MGSFREVTLTVRGGYLISDHISVHRGAKNRREDYLKTVTEGYYPNYSDLTIFFERALERGYAADLSLESDLGDAPSKTDDS